MMERNGAFPKASEAWPGLLRLWPVIFIFIGLDMLLGRNSKFGSPVSAVMALILVGMVALALHNPEVLPPAVEGTVARHETLAVERDDVERIELTISMDDMDTEITPVNRDEAGDVLLEVDAYGYDPELEYEVEDGVAHVSLAESGDWSWVFWTDPSTWLSDEVADETWSIRIAEGIPCSISLSFDDGSHDLQLDELSVDELTVRGDDGSVSVELPYRLRHGVFIMNDGMLEIGLPDVSRRSIGIRLRLQADRGTVVLPDSLEMVGTRPDGQIWETADYDDSEVQIQLEVTIEDGDLTIR